MSEDQLHGEEDVTPSPTPWTYHTNTDDKNISGEAYIRCNDVEDGLLGEIVADVEKEIDAKFMCESVNGQGRKTLKESSKRKINEAVEMLFDIYNGDTENDNDEVYSMGATLRNLLEEYS